MSKIHLEIEIPGNAKTYEFVLDDLDENRNCQGADQKADRRVRGARPVCRTG